MKTLHTILIFILLIILLGSLFSGLSRVNEGFEYKDVEIVISRYNEPLDWLSESLFDKYAITVYNKGQNAEFTKLSNLRKIIPVKNVGKCDHSYLYHIVNNYDNLAEITVFLPGSCNMPNKKDKAIKLIEHIEKIEKAVFLSDTVHENVKNENYDFMMDEWATSDEANKSANSEKTLDKAKIRPFGKWYESNFGDLTVKHMTYSGIFSVSKQDILQHPIDHYKNLMVQLETSSNPEVGHYIERSWAAIFHPMNNTQII